MSVDFLIFSSTPSPTAPCDCKPLFSSKNMVVVNKKAWNKLDDATKKLVMKQAAVAERKGWNLSRQGNVADKKALADAGMVVGKVNSALQSHFEKTGATMAKEWAGRAGSRGQAVLSAYK